ncbi:hypothetical protein AAP_00468 [Ascosphaera apis ARSEF 7405]|uniref:F-box domain-containing protein n=1 Tax=Ascosphaera apis ARSEF 7405 TaxID=392613 RepID=A0A168DX04_9EURO|nr:hypothetical protein AAP_00468 [Ascosphaera apis ARSEF 7405]
MCSSLPKGNGRSDARTMPALLESTIDLLESELAKAKAALEHLRCAEPSILHTCGDTSAKAMAVYRRQLASRLLGHTKAEDHVPPLVKMLSNSVVLDRFAPYLSLPDLFSLASTSSDIRHVLLDHPRVFRHMDLAPRSSHRTSPEYTSESPVQQQPRLNPMMADTNFSGPLRNLFKIMDRRALLKNVRTLVLDGLPVSAQSVGEILANRELSIAILSIRDCQNLDNQKLKHIIKHACRSDRPKDMPKVKGIYLFSSKEEATHPQHNHAVVPANACETSEDNRSQDGSANAAMHPWYKSSGRVLQRSKVDGWADVLKQCEGVMSFDAILCRGPRHNSSYYHLDSSQDMLEPSLPPAVANFALRPDGCEGCHSSIEGPLVWGHSPGNQFPLLSPLNIHTSTVAACKDPTTIFNSKPKLLMQCEQCLTGRHCHRCGKWWCSTCLPISQNSAHSFIFEEEPLQENQLGGSKLGASRDCWECGPTCYDCKVAVNRKCIKCPNGFCSEHHETSSRGLTSAIGAQVVAAG